MKKVICRILPVLAIALVIAIASGTASAQIGGPTGEEFTTNYYANNTTSGAQRQRCGSLSMDQLHR